MYNEIKMYKKILKQLEAFMDELGLLNSYNDDIYDAIESLIEELEIEIFNSGV